MKKRTLLATVALTAILAACGKNEPASNTAAAPAPAPAAAFAPHEAEVAGRALYANGEEETLV